MLFFTDIRYTIVYPEYNWQLWQFHSLNNYKSVESLTEYKTKFSYG